ncbi:Uncharacterized membrane protein YccC [Gillisia sp. Hel1_33_143]|uniref:FUSC family protein n=1 Tax=Gillisia sp. Hel1_33_143 TaxID=1336796 RepID=UPI00087BE476|nr:FUSC family membrane protein [Gillisia sp. Hel1_33_143]SDS53515.1 Uncharacterized membrane protein YccC [Gillisia sp. Hel1_33_143]
MKILNIDVSAGIQDFLSFLKSTDFSKAIILALAITIPIILGVYTEHLEMGIAVGLGALLSSPSDVTGSVRHKYFGILLSSLIAILATLIGGYKPDEFWIILFILGSTTFCLSYLAVYGFRASLISFSGLFALVLSFASLSKTLEVYEKALLIGLGGLWYLLLSVVWNNINPKGQTNQFMIQNLELTSRYIRLRGRLLENGIDRTDLLKELHNLQNDLNENHQKLREILISSRKSSGYSNFQRKRLLTFIQTVDILELAMAHPVDYENMDKILKGYPDRIKPFQELVFTLSDKLNDQAIYLQKNKIYKSAKSIGEIRLDLKQKLDSYRNEKQSIHTEGFLILLNYYEYLEHQSEKIEKIDELLVNPDLTKLRLIKSDDALKFLSTQEYNPKILLENLNLRSSIFKHALRISLVMMVGYCIGEYFSFQNAYWILLTIIVIMRPGYGLTRDRSKQRIIGTVIGAIISIGLVLLIHNVVVYGILGIISLVMAFSMIQKNYKTAAVFITLSVVFVYALLRPDVLNVIQFRVVDTLVGAGLAALGNFLLWPSWEFLGIKTIILQSIKANQKFLMEVNSYYLEKGAVSNSYKLSRKEAFLETGNLSAALQRMTQEPKSKQQNLDNIYQLVVLNHSFLTSLASIGLYIKTHKTTPASNHFKNLIEAVDQNLETAIELLSGSEVDIDLEHPEKLKEALDFFNKNYKALVEEASTFNMSGNLQETQLIFTQLKWLLNLSQNIVSTIYKTKFIN